MAEPARARRPVGGRSPRDAAGGRPTRSARATGMLGGRWRPFGLAGLFHGRAGLTEQLRGY